MNPTEIAKVFYEAFKRKDAQTMGELYSDEVSFSDPVFPRLKGEEARKMWRMLCSRSADLKIDYQVLLGRGQTVQVAWTAHYTFTQTGRAVVNQVLAELTVEEGKITVHRDRFSFWAWSRQALGPAGWLLGWSPLLKAKVRSQAKRSLQNFSS